MLKIYFGSKYIFMENKISEVSQYFDAVYDSTWLSSEWAKRIIKEIDKSEYISGEYIESPVFGGISPRDLSTGCKALLILLNEPDKIISGDRMGDNCYPLLLEMSKDKDYTITLAHWVNLSEYEPLNILNAETGEILTKAIELMSARINKS